MPRTLVQQLHAAERLPAEAGPEEAVRILWIGPEDSLPLAEALAGRGLALDQLCAREVLARSSEIPALHPTILCFGAGATPDLVRSVLDAWAGPAHLGIVLAPAAGPARFQELLDEDRLFYVAGGPLPEADLLALLDSAAEALRRRGGHAGPGRETWPRAAPTAAEAATLRSLALAGGVREAAAALDGGAAEAARAAVGRCLIWDGAEQALWSSGTGDEAGAPHSPAVGLASFVLRTGRRLCLLRVGADDRFDPEVDNPGGGAGDRFLAVPVRYLGGPPVAVLAAWRPPEGEPFAAPEIAALEALALHAAPYLAGWSRPATGPGGPAVQSGPFRQRALSELESPAGAVAEPLRLLPGWTRWSYWLLLSLLAAGLVGSLLVRLPEHAGGAAMVRAGNRVEVTAVEAGVVSSIAVVSGSRVEPGRPLLTLHHAEESARLGRLARELELQLVRRLQAPSDPQVAASLLALSADRDLAAAQLAARQLKAPVAGVVRDLRVAPGQTLALGQPVLSIVGGAERPSVVVLIPGQHLPQLAAGMGMRLELTGYPYLYQWLTLDSVAEEVIGPTEARRLLGPGAGDAVELGGPVAVVTARLPAPTFSIGSATYPYRDGMLGRAEIRVRSERLLLSLVPGLRALFGRGDA